MMWGARGMVGARRRGGQRHCGASRHAAPPRRKNSILAGCSLRRSTASCWRRCAGSAGCDGCFSDQSAEVREKPRTQFINGEANLSVRRARRAARPLFGALTRLSCSIWRSIGCAALPASIANLAALTSLDLSDSKIGDEGAQALKGLTALTSLNLSQQPGSGEGCSAERPRRPHQPRPVQQRHRGRGGQALKGLVNLTSLDLSRNDIGAEGAQALKGLAFTLTSLGRKPSGPRGRRR